VISLPPAVPAYRADVDGLHRALGQAHAYITQLQAQMTSRAQEANRLDDALAAAHARLEGIAAAAATVPTLTAGQPVDGDLAGAVNRLRSTALGEA
jgi:hypothetical protein